MTTNIRLFCPHCGKQLQAQVNEGERTDQRITCASCGAASEVGHLHTAEGKTLLQHAQDMAKEAFESPRSG